MDPRCGLKTHPVPAYDCGVSTSDEAGDDLKEFRDQLDKLDGELLTALAARQNLVTDIIRRKAETGGDLRDTGREAELLGALVARGKELAGNPCKQLIRPGRFRFSSRHWSRSR